MIEGIAKTMVVLADLDLPGGSTGRYAKADTEVNNALFYEGRVISFGRMHREVSDVRAGFVRSIATVRLADHDRHFSDMDLRALTNKKITLRSAVFETPERVESSRVFTSHGDRVLVNGEPLLSTQKRDDTPPTVVFNVIFTGVVAGYRFDDGVFELTAKSMDHRWMDKAFQVQVTRELFPNAPASALGAIIPIVYGEIKGEAS